MEQNITMNKKGSLLGRRNFIGGFIAAHGFMHAMLLSTPRLDGGAGNFVTRGGEIPLLNSIGLGASAIETIGTTLILITTAGLLLAAIMYARQHRSWENWLMAASALSITSLLLYWNDWMVMGPVIGLGLIALALRSRITEVD